MPKLPTAVALNRERQENKERLQAYSMESLSAAIKDQEPYPRPEFLDLPSFRKHPKSLDTPKPASKKDMGKASELSRDARRAEGGDMDTGDRQCDADVEMKEG